jgi:hypothetical protein
VNGYLIAVQMADGRQYIHGQQDARCPRPILWPTLPLPEALVSCYRWQGDWAEIIPAVPGFAEGAD